jgi:hypothetical protein
MPSGQALSENTSEASQIQPGAQTSATMNSVSSIAVTSRIAYQSRLAQRGSCRKKASPCTHQG